MTTSLSPAVRGRRWPATGPFARTAPARTARRTLARSLYLVTAPLTAAAGLLPVLGGALLAMGALLLPGGSPLVARALAPARWFADLERRRIAGLRAPTAGAAAEASAAGHRPWREAAHAVLVLPVAVVTSVVTALWWFVGLAAATCALRYRSTAPGPLRPLSLTAGDERSHIAVSLGLSSPAGRAVFGTAVGLLLLATLPLATRGCTAVQAGLGQVLLRADARARTVAAATAEAAALRRLERDLHDGPQQRLVRLAMELGRAQRYLDSRPETVRVALADAVVQTREALAELRALSRGIAPPVLVDRGLSAALTSLAARSTVPTELDGAAPAGRLDAAVETAAYFVVAECLTNVAKHSHAHRCAIGLRHGGGTLTVWVTDDGVGGAAPDRGHGLRGLEDRLHAVGGRLLISSPSGGPTTVTAVLPC
ncbi:sensor histidine kinase [Kitasatospora sp. NPDC088346]|uniref:sensor histidine kinase n=1 Tax=Kitasatospora sp. NPDC088346 TaxID=3364073 RepID=UPI0038287219